MAGRSEQKLTKLRERLAKVHPAILEVPILTADLSDPKSLDKLVKQSDVLVSMAGPFYKVGYPLVRICVVRQCPGSYSGGMVEPGSAPGAPDWQACGTHTHAHKRCGCADL